MGTGTSGALGGAAQGAAVGTQIMPGWGTAIGAVLGAVVGYFGGKSAEKAAMHLTPEQKVLFEMVRKNATTMSEAGQMLMSMSRDPIISSTNFLQAAANGDSNTLMQLASKDVKNVSEGARQSLQTMSQLMPRSGASAEYLSNIPFANQQQQNQIMLDTHNKARTDLAQWGPQLASLGGSLMNSGSAPGSNLLGFTQGMRNDAFNQGSQVAGGLYDMFNQVWSGVGSAYQAYKGRKPATPSTGTRTPTSPSSFFGGSNYSSSGPG